MPTPTPSSSLDPLARVGRQLVAAAERRARRRRRCAQAASTGAVLAAAAGIAVGGLAILHGGDAHHPDGVEVTVQHGLAHPWTFTAYAAAQASVCVARAPRDAAGAIVCENAALASAATRGGGAALLDAVLASPGHVVVSGLAGAGTTTVSVQASAGSGTDAPTGHVLTVPDGHALPLRVHPFALATAVPTTARDLRITIRDRSGATRTQRVAIDDRTEAPTTDALGRGGGVSLLFDDTSGAAGKPRVDQRQLARLAQARLEAAGVGNSVVTVNDARVAVDLPGARPPDAAPAIAALLGGKPSFFDWEANVISPDGTTVAEALATGKAASKGAATAISQGAGVPREGLTAYRAVRLAAAQPPRTGVARPGAAYYLFDRAHRILAGPASTPARLTAALGEPTRPAGSTMLSVPPGTLVVQATTSGRSVPPSDPAARFYVLHDSPALRGDELVHPRAARDHAGQPEVAFDLPPAGRSRFHALTRTIAHRGGSLVRPGVPPAATFQHFAVVLDGRLVSVPYIDPTQNPDGISGEGGATIQGNFTPATARDLANLLVLPGLPSLTLHASTYVPPAGP